MVVKGKGFNKKYGYRSLYGKMSQDDPESAETLINQVNGNPRLLIERSIFSQKNFDEEYAPGSRPHSSIKQAFRKKLQKCDCSLTCFKNFLFAAFPFLTILRGYSLRGDLPGDVISGLTVGIMHIPQGMAYGMLTTLPPVFGLYTSFFPVIVYFFFGSSKHISMGTFAVACLMVGSAVSRGYEMTAGQSSTSSTSNTRSIPLNMTGLNSTTQAPLITTTETMSAEELEIRLAYAMSVSFCVGCIQLLLGVLRLGFVTVYLSDPLISGFTTGAACHVFTSQIKHVFGISTQRYSGPFKLVYTYRDFFARLPETNSITLITSVLCMFLLYMVSTYINGNAKLKKKMPMPVPIELIVVVLGTVVSYFVQLNDVYNVKIVGDIPVGLPMPALNQFTYISNVISDSIALAIVVFAVSVSMAKILAKKHDYEIDSNQELVAYGICNLVSSFFSSSVASASLSRSLVQERVGGRTQIAGLLSCGLLLVVLLALGPYFKTLPNCVLAAIIIIALRGMFLQLLELPKLWKVSLIDFFVWIIAFVATALLDVDYGLGVGVGFAILTIVCRSQRPYVCVLGQMPGTDIYRDISVYKEAKELDGIKIFRFEHSLIFVNTEHFRNNLYKVTCNPREVKIKMKKMVKKQKDRLAHIRDQMDYSDDTNNFNSSQHSVNEDMELTPPGNDTSAHDTHDTAAPPTPTPAPTTVTITYDVDVITGETKKLGFHTVVLDCSTWSFVDSMGVKVLSAVMNEFTDIGINIFLANCKAGIREMFEKTRFYDLIDRGNVFVTLHDAVVHAQHHKIETDAQADARPHSVEPGTSVDTNDNVEDGQENHAFETKTCRRISDGAPTTDKAQNSVTVNVHNSEEDDTRL